MMIYHIAEQSVWEHTTRDYTPQSLSHEGFIHLSTGEQVLRTAARFYRGRRDLVLLEVDPDRLVAELRYEESEPGEWFPHLYGALNRDAVVAVHQFQPDADGMFQMP